MGCPIRIPLDLPLPARPQGFSQRGRVLRRQQAPRHPPCAHLRGSNTTFHSTRHISPHIPPQLPNPLRDWSIGACVLLNRAPNHPLPLLPLPHPSKNTAKPLTTPNAGSTRHPSPRALPSSGSPLARVAELADALDLGSSAARRGGSTPLSRTKMDGWGNSLAAGIGLAGELHTRPDAHEAWHESKSGVG